MPQNWNYLPEPIIDIANRLILNREWDHKIFYDPISETIGHPAELPEIMPFVQAKPLIIDISTNNIGKADLYIDDNIITSLGINGNH
jgi:hypothetical protein